MKDSETRKHFHWWWKGAIQDHDFDWHTNGLDLVSPSDAYDRRLLFWLNHKSYWAHGGFPSSTLHKTIMTLTLLLASQSEQCDLGLHPHKSRRRKCKSKTELVSSLVHQHSSCLTITSTASQPLKNSLYEKLHQISFFYVIMIVINHSTINISSYFFTLVNNCWS